MSLAIDVIPSGRPGVVDSSQVDHFGLFSAIVVLGLLLASGAVSDFFSDESGTNLVSWILAPLLLISMGRLLLSGRDSVATINPLAVIFVLLALVSIFWSDDVSASIRRLPLFALSTFFALTLIIRLPLPKIISYAAIAVSVAMVVTLITIAVAPRVGISAPPEAEGWKGLFVQKNALGRVAGLGVLLFAAKVYLGIGRPLRNYAMMGLCGFMVLMSDSATTLIVLLSVTLAVFSIRVARKIRLGGLFFGLVLGLVAVVFVLGLQGDAANSIIQLLGRNATFTGRVPLWQELFRILGDQYVWGFGYGAFWTSDNADLLRLHTTLGWDVEQAHNGYIDIVLQTGIVGLIFFVFAGIYRLWTSARSYLRAGDALELVRFAGILYLFLLGAMESIFIQHSNLLAMATMILVFQMPMRQKRK